MGVGSKYAQREAAKLGLFITDGTITDGSSSANEVGTVEVSKTAGSAFVVDTSSKSQEMKNT